MTKYLSILILYLVVVEHSGAQQLSNERMSVYAYEDMSDWIRRLPGMYPMDYGVAGAPVVFRPWGLSPWYVGAERDGIPWHRVSDGLYDSNLDSPDELESLSLEHDRMDPLGTLVLRTRALPTDTATTEVRLREGYYGFGRVDFAHAQSLSKSVTGEGRGRLWWYDGLRSDAGNSYSKSRFYNLSGKLNVQWNTNWRTQAEYGGANVDAQTPAAFLDNGAFRRPQIYSEREYGTLRMIGSRDKRRLEIGVHARQDRETRGDYFGLREQFWYGFVDGTVGIQKSSIAGRVAYEQAEFTFPGSDKRSESGARLSGNGLHDFGPFVLSAGAMRRFLLDKSDLSGGTQGSIETSLNAGLSSKPIAGMSFLSKIAGLSKYVPQFWRFAQYQTQHRLLLVNDAFADDTFFAGEWNGLEATRDASTGLGSWSSAIHWQHDHSFAEVGWKFIRGGDEQFYKSDDTLYYADWGGEAEWQGPTFQCDAKLMPYLSFQSWSSIQCDKNGVSRALDTRSYSRLLFSHDYFKAPLHIDSYIAYEHIGKHRAVSNVDSKVVGPAHLMYIRIEGTIEGVTLIWGAENFTGQHYEYLPGYMLIRKEEYFGLKWTLKL